MSDPPPRPSDAPGPDLTKERDDFVRSFTKAPLLTQHFVQEYEALRHRLAEVEAENGRLRATLEADDAIRELVKKIELLEAEKQDLLGKYRKAEETRSDYNLRFHEMEDDFSNLANLFVASNNLHSSLSPRAVARRIREVLEQLVGAEQYGVYLTFSEGRELITVATGGFESSAPPTDTLLAGPVGEVARSGDSRIDDDADPSQGTVKSPPAVFPLRVDDHVVGVIAIFRSFSQKTRFSTVDFELFKLLGQHAASALMSSGLFAQANRTLPGPSAFADLDR